MKYLVIYESDFKSGNTRIGCFVEDSEEWAMESALDYWLVSLDSGSIYCYALEDLYNEWDIYV